MDQQTSYPHFAGARSTIVQDLCVDTHDIPLAVDQPFRLRSAAGYGHAPESMEQRRAARIAARREGPGSDKSFKINTGRTVPYSSPTTGPIGLSQAWNLKFAGALPIRRAGARSSLHLNME
jgi:hypothetical protein